MAKLKKAQVEDNLETGVITWLFTNGHKRELNVFSLSEDVKKWLMIHGAGQKASDCYAGAESIEEAVEANERVCAALERGEVNVRREAGEKTPALFNEAFERFVVNHIPAEKQDAARKRVTEGGPDKNGKHLSGEEWRKALRELPQIKAIIAEIQVERAKAAAAKPEAIDIADLLAV